MKKIYLMFLVCLVVALMISFNAQAGIVTYINFLTASQIKNGTAFINNIDAGYYDEVACNGCYVIAKRSNKVRVIWTRSNHNDIESSSNT